MMTTTIVIMTIIINGQQENYIGAIVSEDTFIAFLSGGTKGVKIEGPIGLGCSELLGLIFWRTFAGATLFIPSPLITKNIHQFPQPTRFLKPQYTESCLLSFRT